MAILFFSSFVCLSYLTITISFLSLYLCICVIPNFTLSSLSLYLCISVIPTFTLSSLSLYLCISVIPTFTLSSLSLYLCICVSVSYQISLCCPFLCIFVSLILTFTFSMYHSSWNMTKIPFTLELKSIIFVFIELLSPASVSLFLSLSLCPSLFLSFSALVCLSHCFFVSLIPLCLYFSSLVCLPLCFSVSLPLSVSLSNPSHFPTLHSPHCVSLPPCVSRRAVCGFRVSLRCRSFCWCTAVACSPSSASSPTTSWASCRASRTW